jgi:hypothetical protein
MTATPALQLSPWFAKLTAVRRLMASHCWSRRQPPEAGLYDFAVTLSDVRHSVAFLLVLVGKINLKHTQQGSSSNVEGAESFPIPVTAVMIGEPDGDEGYLGIEVGQANLIFSVPISEFSPLGRNFDGWRST